MLDRETLLRRLASGDRAFVDAYLAARRTTADPAILDHPGEALVVLGAIAATECSDVTWQAAVRTALDAGVTRDEIVDALLVLVPLVGWPRVVAAAPKVGLAIGYDVGAPLEAPAWPR